MPFHLAALRRTIRPFRLHWYPTLRSTNDQAMLLRKRQELFAPAVVLTGNQTAGRGRGANRWWSGDGSLTVTFALPADERLAAHHVPLLAGLAVRGAAAELCGDDGVQLKWPNDLQHGGRKLAGLLCERVDRVDLIGVGMNVAVESKQIPRGLRDRVTSLSSVADKPIEPQAAVIVIAQRLHAALTHRDETTFAAALAEYDRYHVLVGRRVTITNAHDPVIAGVCQGLDDTGRLLVREGRTTHRVIAGHVEAR